MPTRYHYVASISNDYLGVMKVVRAATRSELEYKVEAQLRNWSFRENAARERNNKRIAREQKESERDSARLKIEKMKFDAAQAAEAEKDKISAYNNILIESVGVDFSLEWEDYYDRQEFPPFDFRREKPDKDRIRIQLLGEKPTRRIVASIEPETPSFLEFLLPFVRRSRIRREQEAESRFQYENAKAEAEFLKRSKEYRKRENEVVEAFNAEVREYNDELKIEYQKYKNDRDRFLHRQKTHNDKISELRFQYEEKSTPAINEYINLVFERFSKSDAILSESPRTRFDQPSRTLVVDQSLPSPSQVPKIIDFKFITAHKSINPVEMKPKEFEVFYESIVQQIALRTINVVVGADYAHAIEAVVINGWVSDIDRKTGRRFTSCVLSCETSREIFMELDLTHVSPKDCIRGLKGITAGPLIMTAPVKPIMQIDRSDSRFVESRQVLNEIGPECNLAAMDWEQFEHLVRELFEKEFARSEGEVRVTQASRDGGVDAIAFDPDPIRGGKFVIQAKRYNIVVPVSAVRDLYGTTIAEGAVKGILVTTSHFGRDSREFAKDKPISLIDGENLVYMFQQHGRTFNITTLPKGDPRRGF